MGGDGKGKGKEEGEGKGGDGLQPPKPKLKFLVPPLHERRQSTRFTSDLDPHFINPGSAPELLLNKVYSKIAI